MLQLTFVVDVVDVGTLAARMVSQTYLLTADAPPFAKAFAQLCQSRGDKVRLAPADASFDVKLPRDRSIALPLALRFVATSDLADPVAVGCALHRISLLCRAAKRLNELAAVVVVGTHCNAAAWVDFDLNVRIACADTCSDMTTLQYEPGSNGSSCPLLSYLFCVDECSAVSVVDGHVTAVTSARRQAIKQRCMESEMRSETLNCASDALSAVPGLSVAFDARLALAVHGSVARLATVTTAQLLETLPIDLPDAEAIVSALGV